MLLSTGRQGLERVTRAALTAVLTLMCAAVASADEPKTEDQDPAAANPVIEFFKQTEVSGLVDAYYLWSANEEPLQLRNFDVQHNAFTLNYAEIAIGKPVSDTSRAGFRLDFGAGETAEMVNAFEPGGTDYLKYVQQAYVSYLAPVGSGLTLDFGKFVTPAGAEVIENKDNFNYSRGLLFSLAIPYYHTGARLGYAVNDRVSVTGFLLNGWNNVIENNDAKTVGVSLSLKPTEKVGVIANYLVGEEFADEDNGGTRNLVDVVVSFAATDQLSVLGNVDYGKDSLEGLDADWYGVALGAKYQLTDALAIAPRYEYFKDDDGFATGVAQALQEVTLTAEYKATGGLITRFEFRTDFSDEDFFAKGIEFESSQPSFSVAFIYAFSSK